MHSVLWEWLIKGPAFFSFVLPSPYNHSWGSQAQKKIEWSCLEERRMRGERLMVGRKKRGGIHWAGLIAGLCWEWLMDDGGMIPITELVVWVDKLWKGHLSSLLWKGVSNRYLIVASSIAERKTINIETTTDQRPDWPLVSWHQIIRFYTLNLNYVIVNYISVKLVGKKRKNTLKTFDNSCIQERGAN